MLKEFSSCLIFLILFIYLDIAAVLTYTTVISISSCENLAGLRIEESCQHCGVKIISIFITLTLLTLIFIFVGCVGSYRRKKPIKKFVILLALLFAVEIVSGVAIYMKRDEIRKHVRENMFTTFKNYNKRSTVKKSINYFQCNIKCCGVDGPNDWLPHGRNTSVLPESCCPPFDLRNTINCTTESSYKQGCYTAIDNVFTGNSIFLYILLGIFVLIQFFGIIFGIYLSRTTKGLQR